MDMSLPPTPPSGPQYPYLLSRRQGLHQCSQTPFCSDTPGIWVCPTLLSSVAASLAVCFSKGHHVAAPAWWGTDLFRKKYAWHPTFMTSPLICPGPCHLGKKKSFILLLLSPFLPPHPTQLRAVWLLEPGKQLLIVGAMSVLSSVFYHLAIINIFSRAQCSQVSVAS